MMCCPIPFAQHIIAMRIQGIVIDSPFVLYNYFRMKALRAACKPLILLDFHRSFNDTPTMSSVIMIAGTIICLAVPGQLIGLFTANEATVQAGKTALRIISAGFLVSAVSVTSSGALEGLGKGTASLVISLCRYVIVILPAAFLLSRIFGAAGVWNAFWIAEAVTAIVSFMISRKKVYL